ncbi:MAG: tetratricopeptide repeat protein [bacterium]
MKNSICRWKLVFLSFIFSFAIVVSTCSMALSESGAAMITDVAGGGQCLKSGQKSWKAASIMQVLSKGDKIKTGKNSRISLVFFGDSHKETLQGDSQALVSEAGCKLEKGKKTSLVKTSAAKTSSLKVTPARMPGRMSKMNVVFMKSFGNTPNTLELKSPSVTATVNPEFRWNTVRDVDSYSFTLSGDTGEILWQKVLQINRLLYPSSAPQLEWGKSYFWDIKAMKENKVLYYGSGSFQILPKAELAEVESAEKTLYGFIKENPEDATPYVLLGNIYLQKALYEKASKIFEKISVMRPNDLKCHESLADLYHILGNTEKEIQEVQMINKLSK